MQSKIDAVMKVSISIVNREVIKDTKKYEYTRWIAFYLRVSVTMQKLSR